MIDFSRSGKQIRLELKYGHAKAYQIESNPWHKFTSLQAPSVREAIDRAMERYKNENKWSWKTGTPPKDGSYKVLIIRCDCPYETGVEEDEFKEWILD